MSQGYLSKTAEAISIWLSGDKNKALGIFKTFKMGVSRDEKRILEIAHEINTGHSAFYLKMGYDTNEVLREAEEIILAKWVS